MMQKKIDAVLIFCLESCACLTLDHFSSTLSVAEKQTSKWSQKIQFECQSFEPCVELKALTLQGGQLSCTIIPEHGAIVPHTSSSTLWSALSAFFLTWCRVRC